MEADNISTLPVPHVEISQNVKKNVSFNIQSNILYFNKEQSSSFLEGMEADYISTFPDSDVENNKNINSNNLSGMFCNAESNTSFADDVDLEQSKLNVIEKQSGVFCNVESETSFADDVDLERSKLNLVEKPSGVFCNAESKTSFADDVDLEQSKLNLVEKPSGVFCNAESKTSFPDDVDLEQSKLNIVEKPSGVFCNAESKTSFADDVDLEQSKLNVVEKQSGVFCNAESKTSFADDVDLEQSKLNLVEKPSGVFCNAESKTSFADDVDLEHSKLNVVEKQSGVFCNSESKTSFAEDVDIEQSKLNLVEKPCGVFCNAESKTSIADDVDLEPPKLHVVEKPSGVFYNAESKTSFADDVDLEPPKLNVVEKPSGVFCNAESKTSFADDVDLEPPKLNVVEKPSGVFCNDESKTSFADDVDLEQSELNVVQKPSSVFCNAESKTSFADDVDIEQSKLNVVENPCMQLKNLVINLEKLPLNILNKFNGKNHICDGGSKNVILKKTKANLSRNAVQTNTRCINQNRDIHTPHTINAQNVEYNKDTIQTIASDSLLRKDKTFQELKVSLQPLPNYLLTLDKINLKNLKHIISSSSVKPANNQCSDQRSLKRPNHKVSKSKFKILKKKLLKRSKQNISKYFENEGRCDSVTSLDSVPINSEEGIIPKSRDHEQSNKVRTVLCIEAERFNTSFDLHPLSSDPVTTSAISNLPSKNAKPVEISDITVSCASSSVMCLLRDCIKEVSRHIETGIKDSSNNLTDSITKKVIASNSLLTKDKTFRELKVSLQPLPDYLMTLDKINLRNLKHIISSSSVKPAHNQCSDLRSRKRPKHKVSKSKFKIFQNKLLKRSKQNILKYFENEGKCDRITSLDTAPINSEEVIIPKFPDHEQGDNVRTALCIEAERFNTSFDVHPFSSDPLSTSVMSNFSSKSPKSIEISDNITASCTSSSVMSLLQDCIKEVSRHIETGIKDSSNNLTNSITKKVIASDSLLKKDKTFRELKVSLQPLPDYLLTLDKINLRNLKHIISSYSVKRANNQCSDQRSLKRPKHDRPDISKSKFKIFQNKLLKRSKQNILKYFGNEGRCDSVTSLDSAPINSEEGIIPKSPDHEQGDKVRTALCIEAERFNTSFDLHPLSSDPVTTSAISNLPTKSAKPVEISDNITASCASSSVMSLLQDCIKEVSRHIETGIKDSSNNLTNSITKKVNTTENKIGLTKDESNYPNYCNISFKKPVVVLERLNLVLPETECAEMNVQTTNKGNLQIGNNLHSQSTSGKVQEASKKNAKLKSSLRKELKILKKKKKIEKSIFGSRDLSVNNLCEDDAPLLLFANNNHLKKKKHSTSDKKIKNKSKSLKKDKKFSKFDSKELSSRTPCEEDLPLLLFANNNHKKKQNYFTSKKMIKNKHKSFERAKNFSKFDSKDLSMDNTSSKFKSMDLSVDNLSEGVEEGLPLIPFANNNHVKPQNYFDFKKMTKNKFKSFKKNKFSKLLSVDTPCEDDVPLMLFANKYKKKQNYFNSKKKIKNNKSSKSNSTSNLKTITMDHSYFCSPSSMNAMLDSDLSTSSPLTNIEMDHNYVSFPNVVQSLEMPANLGDVPSEFSKTSKKENNEKKIECPTCLKMDNPHVFLKTYMNKFCSSFDYLGKKEQSDIETARKNQEYGYNYIINKLHSHLEVTCSVKESYKKQCSQDVKSASLVASEKNISQTSDIQVSSANDSCTSLLHSETANEENNYDLSEMLFAARRNSNNQHRSKSRVDKYRLGFLAANNPLRLYNKCLASERFLLSKYEMTEDQRKKLKKMFSSLKNNAAAIEKIV